MSGAGAGSASDVPRVQGATTNPRNAADEAALLATAALAGFVPRFTHRADSLELVPQLIAAGLGVAPPLTDRSATTS